MTTCSKCQHAMSEDDRFCPECGEPVGEKPASVDVSAMQTVGGLETLDDTGTVSPSSRKQPELAPGTVFAGRYTIEDVVGRGGMGVVYRADDKLAKKQVALKLIRPERLAGSNAVDRLISEGITARDIRHPNIVAVYDVGEEAGQPFVSMEYLDGQSLRAWHRQKVQAREDVPLRVAARIIAEILDGLKAAHAAGVIHRDLKPENIILAGEPDDKAAPLKILDFGIARAAGGTVDSGTGTGLGTPRYMAPEQITNPDAAGPPADLYSVSVIFYELLVDVLPQGHWQPPSGGRSDVPADIDALIEKGLSNRPANRPQSAEDYRSALVDAVNLGRPPAPDPRPTPGPVGPGGKIKPWWYVAGAGVAGVVLIAAVWPEDVIDDDPCVGLVGDSWRMCMGYDVNDDPDPVPDPDDEDGPPYSPPPPPPPPVRALNGQWNDGSGIVYDIRMSDSGQFSGDGYGMDGGYYTIRGSLSGSNGTYVVSAPAMGLSLQGRASLDRQCHISYQTFDPSGTTIVAQGQMHVNHNPGEPCP